MAYRHFNASSTAPSSSRLEEDPRRHTAIKRDPATKPDPDTYHLANAVAVAIFHIRTRRVVLCRQVGHNYYFLPQRQLKVDESPAAVAEHGAFRRSGFANRLLPLHVQKDFTMDVRFQRLIATQSITLWATAIEHAIGDTHGRVVYWYIAETIPGRPTAGTYRRPEPYPERHTLASQMRQESFQEFFRGSSSFFPARKDKATGVESKLVPVGLAVHLLKGTGMQDIVAAGWAAIMRRLRNELGANPYLCCSDITALFNEDFLQGQPAQVEVMRKHALQKGWNK